MPHIVWSELEELLENKRESLLSDSEVEFYYTERPYISLEKRIEDMLPKLYELKAGLKELKAEITELKMEVRKARFLLDRLTAVSQPESKLLQCIICNTGRIHGCLPAGCQCKSPSLCKTCWAMLVPTKELTIVCPVCQGVVADKKTNPNGAIFGSSKAAIVPPISSLVTGANVYRSLLFTFKITYNNRSDDNNEALM